jgi:hypothetical protein
VNGFAVSDKTDCFMSGFGHHGRMDNFRNDIGRGGKRWVLLLQREEVQGLRDNVSATSQLKAWEIFPVALEN